MELTNKFPVGFFEKPRPSAPKIKSDIIPIKWSIRVQKDQKKALIKKAISK